MAEITHATAAVGTDDPSGGQISKNAWNEGHAITGDLITGGSLVLLDERTASTDATIDFASVITSAYDTYLFELVNVKPVSDNVYLYVRCSTDGGVNFDTSAIYDTAGGYYYVGGAGVAGAAGDNLSAMRLMDTVGNGGSYSVSGSFTLYEPLSTSKYKTLTGQSHMYHATVSKIVGISSSHVYKSTTAVNAIRFLFSSGSIASGTIRVYGVAKTQVVAIGSFGGEDLDVSPNPTSNDQEFKSALSGWTTVGSPTVADANATGYDSLLRLSHTATGTFQIHGLVRAIPSMPFTVTARIPDYQVTANFQTYGFLLTDGTKYFVWGPLYQSTNGVPELGAFNWTNRTTRSGTFTEYTGTKIDRPKYLRMVVNSSTSVDLWWSVDGKVWVLQASTWNPNMTIASWGFGLTGQDNSVAASMVVDWGRFGTAVIQPEAVVWQNVGGLSVSGFVLLEEHTASSSATLDFTTRNAPGQSGATIRSDFDEYLVEVVGVVAANNNVTFKCSLSSDGGSSWNATSNYYSALGYVLNSGGAGGVTLGNPTTFWALAGEVTNSSSRSTNATLRLASPLSTALDKTLYGSITYTNQGNFVGATFAGLFTVPGTAFNAIQFLMSAGNIASGTIRVYGITKA